MLNSTTKAKINNLRDLLVGKIPNPQGQVQQITLALIYKFMSDIDDETSGIFANGSFFPGEFAQYKWTDLMDSKLSAQERLNLYAEGLEKMNHNPAVPPLFRTIFKQAFLPYRDATTLSNFLKQINEFHYEHSEDLGDAFEYLLSCLSAAGDAGQFRTPRHIIDFIVDVVQPQITDKILDPACGTAGFLISAYKYLTRHHQDIDMTKLSEQIIGYDISPDMVQLALVNLYLHQFPDPKVMEYDTLTSEDKRSDKFDCILANPPFMTPKGGIQPHNKFSITSNRSEVLFVDYIIEHLRANGKAGIIVPEGVIFQSANAYKGLRKMLIETGGLWGVISLPAGVFQPYSGVKTSILLIDKSIQTDQIIFAKITADGYDLGAQRREISKNDLPEVLEELLRIKNKLSSRDADLSHPQETDIASECPYIWSVPKTELADDYNLSAERYKTGVVAHTGSYEMVELGEICEVGDGNHSGNYPKAEEMLDEGVKFIRSVNIQNSYLIPNDIKYISPEKHIQLKKGRLKTNDVLFTNRGEIGKTAIVNNFFDGSNLNSQIAWLRSEERLLPKFLWHVLRSPMIQDKIESEQAGATLKQYTIKQLKALKIPLPPLEIQEQIVKELDGYQAIIDGAKQIISHWKPTIEVDSEWEMVKLGEVMKINDGNIAPSTYGDSFFTYLDITAIENYTGKISYDNKVKGNDAPSRAKRKVRQGDILLSTVRPNLQAFGFLDIDPIDCIASTGFAVLSKQNNEIENKFIYRLLFSEELQNQMIAKMDKGAYPSINSDDVKNLQIPLPPLDVQQSIIARIQHEQSLVNSVKELVKIYEEKVKERVERVRSA